MQLKHVKICRTILITENITWGYQVSACAKSNGYCAFPYFLRILNAVATYEDIFALYIDSLAASTHATLTDCFHFIIFCAGRAGIETEKIGTT